MGQKAVELPEPIAPPVDVDDMHVVQEAVEDRGGEDLVTCEDLWPVAHVLVRGQDDGALLVPGAHEPEEQVGLLLEARSLDELQAVINRQMRYYTRERRHSSVGNQPPLAYLKSEGFNPRQRCRNQL